MTSVTRDHFHPQYQRELEQDEVMRDPREEIRAEDVSVRELPKRDRIVTYPNPDGPAFVSTGVLEPYGEDPTDPATLYEPRRQTAGMIARFHPPAWKRRG